MKKNKGRDELLRQLKVLAKAKVNDGVKLAYLEQDQVDLIDQLDLTALTEFKRSSNGVVEIKFTDRVKMLQQLLVLSEEKGEDPVENLLKVMTGQSIEAEK